MKKIIGIGLAFVLAISMTATALAAEPTKLGSEDFSSSVSGNYTVVKRTVIGRNETFEITGLSYPAQAKEVFRLMNIEREKEGLKKLTWEDGLAGPAIQRALEQYVLRSHTRPNGQDCYSVSSLCNGENAAGGDTDAADVMEGWMNSPGHKENILDPDYSSVAVACVETDQMCYWVQLFHSDIKVNADGTKITAGSSTSSASSGSSSTGGAPSGSVTTTAGSAGAAVSQTSLLADLNKSKSGSAATAKVKNADSIAQATIAAANSWANTNKAGVTITADTSYSGGAGVQGRMVFNPASFAGLQAGKSLRLGVRVEESAVSAVRKNFNKWYKNNVTLIKMDAAGNLGGMVQIAAKADLSKLDTKSLVFYSYDKTANTISMLEKPEYTVDKNGYLHFLTNKGGFIVVTDKALAR